MLNTEFTAAVLEGIEGTLDELIGRVDPSDLRDRLTALQDETAAVRRSLEEMVSARVEYTGARSGTGTRLGSPEDERAAARFILKGDRKMTLV